MIGKTRSAVFMFALALSGLMVYPQNPVHAADKSQVPKQERKDERQQQRQQAKDELRSPVAPGQQLQLFESPSTLKASNRKPNETFGVIYYVHGRRRVPTGDSFAQPQPYMLRTLQENGWDVIIAKIPSRYDGHTWGHELVPGAARFLKRRASELKAQGYPRVVIAGFAWGAWVTATAAQGEFAADSLVLINPTVYGPSENDRGVANRDFKKNLTELQPLLNGIRTPSVVLTSAGNRYIADGIGDYARQQFEKNKVLNFVLDKPPGFTGQYAEYLPVYDYIYGNCISEFLLLGDTETCFPMPLIDDEYRSIVYLKQVSDVDKKRVTSAEVLRGRQFNVYPLGDLLSNYIFAPGKQTLRDTAEREVYQGKPLKPAQQEYSFRDGQFCIEKDCGILLAWTPGQFLFFDIESGKLKASWVERKGEWQ